MSQFLIVPISGASQGFRVGAVLDEASKSWMKNSQYLRVLGQELSVTDAQLIKNLGIKKYLCDYSRSTRSSASFRQPH